MSKGLNKCFSKDDNIASLQSFEVSAHLLNRWEESLKE